ncbi:SMI1/KNR4 family protein [Amycolatopsis sp. QT-25]|uniref:SMI1/KNR4 family protein n=1 Tax=Amycolatopsis sp. QT-25 TaxID=3034022 RepID=UPI0023EDF811|nr:SMI1/KNR4 family protein [Amycolatopsis sp. QT-25]WET76744.1 SMI1/KNR4 family protein [Amycolatopsis sp. QT-25]
MSAVEASERLIDLVRANPDLANHAEGCDELTVATAERVLGIPFPPSCRRLIEEFGTWDIAGEEFFGVYRTPALGKELLGSVMETLSARDQYGMPADLIVVMSDGMGGLVVLDSSQVDEVAESPVRVWNPGVPDRGSMETLGENFGLFALDLCQRAVTRWREGS